MSERKEISQKPQSAAGLPAKMTPEEIDPRDELEFQGRYREDAGMPDEACTRAIARGVAEIDRLRAALAARNA